MAINENIENYQAGAVTALSYMADGGAPKWLVMGVAETMDLSFDDIDESDRERLVQAYGEI
ncbi:hypothetical protein [Halomonas sp. 3A7M]|uniref:hypothetical protein n=1 Tax=Halomonas sp. 3A7M TaxID=2742616 RepID=UPI001868E942|nr:hypothetical protein [Halomonas sp. 3A7M]